MKYFNLDDAISAILAGGYKFIALFSNNGEILVNFNQYGKDHLQEKINEIKKRFDSKGLQDGIYIIHAKNANGRSKAAPDLFHIKKGDLSNNHDQIIIREVIKEPAAAAATPQVTTYESALNREVTIKQLELDLDAAKRRILELEEEVEELKADLEEEAEHLGENQNQSFWQQLAEMAAPMIDKHFDLKEKQLNLEAAKFSAQYGKPAQPQRQQRQQPQTPAEPDLQASIVAWINSKGSQPELYEDLAEIFNTAESQEDFKEKLINYNSELYEELRRSIEG